MKTDEDRDAGAGAFVHLLVVAAVLVALVAGLGIAVPSVTRIVDTVRGVVTTLEPLLRSGGESAPTSHGRSAPARSAGASRRPHPAGPGTAAGSTRSRTSTANPLTAAVRADAQGIVRITGIAAACSVEQEGSGFVVSPDHVVTNAHVVQGLRAPRLQIAGAGTRYPARVVFYDPGIDIAVLDVPGLPARPLSISTAVAAPGTAVVAAGFPLGGPLRLSTGSVRAEGLEVGPAVGSATPRRRPVYELSVVVKPGNSGGPLLTSDGHVVGIVFARGGTRTPTGFAITSGAAFADVRGALAATRPVSTGTCG